MVGVGAGWGRQGRGPCTIPLEGEPGLLYCGLHAPFPGNHGHLGSIHGGSQDQRIADWHSEPSYLGQWEVGWGKVSWEGIWECQVQSSWRL